MYVIPLAGEELNPLIPHPIETTRSTGTPRTVVSRLVADAPRASTTVG